MTSGRRRVVATLAALLALPALEARAQTVPAGGVSLVDVGDVAIDGDFYSYPVGRGTVAVRTIVPASGQGFERAARFAVENPTGEFWASAVSAESNRATADGDVVLVHFFMRAVESRDETGSVFCNVYVEGPEPDYAKSMFQQVSAGPGWTEIFLPLVVQGSYPAGDLAVRFGFGAGARPQVLELGGVEAIWYGKSLSLAEMPLTSFRYDGREPDAAWRAEAMRRIERHRKGDYEVRVVNAAGLPVVGAGVHTRLRRHRFQFGTAFVAARVVDQTLPENRTYLAKLRELFNAGSPENSLKWPPWDGEWGAEYDRSQTLAALSLLAGEGFRLRGHVLVWPSESDLPEGFAALIARADPSIRQRVLDHIRDIVGATRDYLEEWDVVNEPYDSRDLMDLFGDQIMVDWFKAARARHPTARLMINDYGILSDGGVNAAKQQAFEDTIRFLVDDGAPIGGVGLQSHFDASPTGIPRVLAVLDRYARAFPDLALRITEFDVDTDDEALQADYTRDFLTAVFSHPQVIGFQMWGFWEGTHWRPRAAMYREDWSEKPNGAVYRDLVLSRWWTDDTATTEADGRVRGRGFLGDYDVMVEVGGRTFAGTLELSADGGMATVVADAAAR